MHLRGKRRLTRSSPSEAKKRELLVQDHSEQISSRVRPTKLPAYLGSRCKKPDGRFRPQLGRSPKVTRILRSRSHCNASKPRRRVRAPKQRLQEEEAFRSSIRVEKTSDRLQECVICAEEKGKYVSTPTL